MRRLALTLIVGLLMASSSFAKDDLATARGIIEQQIVAFLNDDVETAYSLAAPGVKSAFPEPKTFVEMVKRNYLPVYRPGNYAFGRALSDTRGDTIAQELLITGPNGKNWRAVYILEKQDDGNYRITGVRLSTLKAPSI